MSIRFGILPTAYQGWGHVYPLGPDAIGMVDRDVSLHAYSDQAGRAASENPAQRPQAIRSPAPGTYREVRLDVFLEVDFRVLLRLAGLLVRLEVFRAEDVLPREAVLFPREEVLFEMDPALPLVFFELPPARPVLEPDRAAFSRRVRAPTPAVPAAPAAAPRRGPAAFFAA